MTAALLGVVALAGLCMAMAIAHHRRDRTRCRHCRRPLRADERTLCAACELDWRTW